MHATLEQPRMTEAEQDNAASKLLNDLARKANAASMDPATAAKRLHEMLLERNGEAEALRELLYWRGLLDVIYQTRHSEKTSIKREPAKPCRLDPAAVASVGKMKAKSYAETWRMPDGRSLAEWTGTELLAEAEEIRNQIRGQEQIRDFYQALAKKAGDRPVGQAVPDKACRALAKKIWGDDAEA